ncbi:hypothetical protein [Halomicrococcus gelatinilyticus]
MIQETHNVITDDVDLLLREAERHRARSRRRLIPEGISAES